MRWLNKEAWRALAWAGVTIARPACSAHGERPNPVGKAFVGIDRIHCATAEFRPFEMVVYMWSQIFWVSASEVRYGTASTSASWSARRIDEDELKFACTIHHKEFLRRIESLFVATMYINYLTTGFASNRQHRRLTVHEAQWGRLFFEGVGKFSDHRSKLPTSTMHVSRKCGGHAKQPVRRGVTTSTVLISRMVYHVSLEISHYRPLGGQLASTIFQRLLNHRNIQ